MQNFPIEYDGQTYWRSRSVAVVGLTFCKNPEGEWCVLAEQRGPGAPNCQTLWCAVCGYLDFNETGQEGVARETFEETGIVLKPEQFTLETVAFSSNGEQNVSIIYSCVLNGNKCTTDYKLSNEHNELDETMNLRWVPLSRMYDFEYEWAFGHSTLIPTIASKLGIYQDKFLCQIG